MNLLGRYNGSVITWLPEKGFGFIKIREEIINGEYIETKEFTDDAFIHFKDIEPEKSHTEFLKKLYQNDIVEFDLYRDGKKLKAKDLTVKGDGYDSNGDINGNA